MFKVFIIPYKKENGKMGEFRLTGNVPVFVIDLFKRLFPKMKEGIASDADEERIRIRDSDWFKKMEAKTTPGESLHAMRTLRGMKQIELEKKIGVNPQQISDMEKGWAPIGKKMAMKIGEALNFNYKHFL
jgi:DNA-binding XRE family transcriptional regulator